MFVDPSGHWVAALFGLIAIGVMAFVTGFFILATVAAIEKCAEDATTSQFFGDQRSAYQRFSACVAKGAGVLSTVADGIKTKLGGFGEALAEAFTSATEFWLMFKNGEIDEFTIAVITIGIFSGAILSFAVVAALKLPLVLAIGVGALVGVLMASLTDYIVRSNLEAYRKGAYNW